MNINCVSELKHPLLLQHVNEHFALIMFFPKSPDQLVKVFTTGRCMALQTITHTEVRYRKTGLYDLLGILT